MSRRDLTDIEAERWAQAIHDAFCTDHEFGRGDVVAAGLVRARLTLSEPLATDDRIERLTTALRVATHTPHDQDGSPVEGFPVCSVCGAIQTEHTAPDKNCVTLPDGECVGTGCMHEPPVTGLDAAWAKAEAALPEGFSVAIKAFVDDRDPEQGGHSEWQFCAYPDTVMWSPTRRGFPTTPWNGTHRTYPAEGYGPTPAAALEALAARLTGAAE